jgi:hypothetical protein
VRQVQLDADLRRWGFLLIHIGLEDLVQLLAQPVRI